MWNYLGKYSKEIGIIGFSIFIIFLPGCYTLNKGHNMQHSETFKNDLMMMHKDIDSFLSTDKPSSLSDY